MVHSGVVNLHAGIFHYGTSVVYSTSLSCHSLHTGGFLCMHLSSLFHEASVRELQPVSHAYLNTTLHALVHTENKLICSHHFCRVLVPHVYCSFHCGLVLKSSWSIM